MIKNESAIHFSESAIRFSESAIHFHQRLIRFGKPIICFAEYKNMPVMFVDNNIICIFAKSKTD